MQNALIPVENMSTKVQYNIGMQHVYSLKDLVCIFFLHVVQCLLVLHTGCRLQLNTLNTKQTEKNQHDTRPDLLSHLLSGLC